ncbi:hypothetical protein D3C72_1368060 [compost metagenome]
MNFLGKAGLFAFSALLITLFFMQDANAQLAGRSAFGRSPTMGGNMSLGLGLSTVGVSQDDMNGAMDDAHTSKNSNTKNLGSAWEIFAQWVYRYERSSYALVIRPSYFTQSEQGSGDDGDYDYKLSGFTLFPMFRLYALENSFIHFFMQTGLGYGQLAGEITAGSQSLDFKGGAFGAVGGIGVDFCFTDAHCVTVEGNLRYLPIERNITTGGNCTDGSIPGISQCGGGKEVERDGNDLKTSMSGVQGSIGYTFNF